MDDDIRNFRKRVLQFIFAPVLLYIPWLPFGIVYGPQLLERAKGPSAQTQTDHAFTKAESRDYDLLFLGNSRIYRGVNPDHFATPTFNFACDNDTFNQMYYKLKWLREREKPFQHLVIGMDFFQFEFKSDHRNHLYSQYLDDAYLADYEPRPYAEEKLWLKRFVRSLNPKYLFIPDNGRTFLRDNGQFIKAGIATPADKTARTTRLLPLQVDYFERMLADCREHGTQVVLCMLPIRPEEKNAYKEGEMEAFMEFIEGYTNENVALIDLTRDDGYAMSDYTDITHLNEAAADRLSVQLNGLLMPMLDQFESNTQIATEPSGAPILR
jgi:hypothetical protein